MTPLITIVVPIVVFQSPGLTAPDAICDAQPSVIPTVTLICSGSSSVIAISSFKVPITVPDGNTSGSHSFFKGN
ncbi:hypothetical protein D3C78_1781850 [compost metagenome]